MRAGDLGRDDLPQVHVVGEAIKAFCIRGLTRTYVLDRNGRIAYRALGPRSFDDPAIVPTRRRLILAARGLGRRPIAAEHDVSQHDSVVVLLIPRAEHERDESFSRERAQSLDLFWMVTHFSRITALEFGPSHGIVTEPPSQLSAGSELL